VIDKIVLNKLWQKEPTVLRSDPTIKNVFNIGQALSDIEHLLLYSCGRTSPLTTYDNENNSSLQVLCLQVPVICPALAMLFL